MGGASPEPTGRPTVLTMTVASNPVGRALLGDTEAAFSQFAVSTIFSADRKHLLAHAQRLRPAAGEAGIAVGSPGPVDPLRTRSKMSSRVVPTRALATALSERQTILLAKGILRERNVLSVDEANSVLRRAARSRHNRVARPALRIVASAQRGPPASAGRG